MDTPQIYDVLIVGGGPAGFAAALYCARAGLSAVVLEGTSPGGQMSTTDCIENYPGLEAPLGGLDLALRMKEEAERFGASFAFARVTALDLTGPQKLAQTTAGPFAGSALILATGADPRPLGVPEEDALRGRGLSYCATCDGMFFKGKTVAVVGGGDSAAAEAILLARLCKQVYLIHRRDTLRCDRSYLPALEKAENLEFVWNAQVTRLLHETLITGVEVTDRTDGSSRVIPCDGVFVAIGRTPATELVQGVLEMDEGGWLLVDESTRTSIPGVFAAGDLRRKPLRQVITAASDGAVAARAAEEYLSGLNASR